MRRFVVPLVSIAIIAGMVAYLKSQEERASRDEPPRKGESFVVLKDYFPIQYVVGAGSADVAERIGEPDRWEKTASGPKAVHAGGAVEVVYIDDRADWVTIYPTGTPLEFKSEAVTHYLRITGRPDFKNRHVMRWKSNVGLLEVSAFPDGGGRHVRYIYVIGRTAH